MSDDNQHPHSSLHEWTQSVLGALETEEGLRRAFYEAVNSPLLTSSRDRLLELYADHDWNGLRELLQTSFSRLENEIRGLPTQVQKEQELTFAAPPREGAMLFTEAEKRVHQGGAGSRRKFIQDAVATYAKQINRNKHLSPLAIEQSKTTILSVIDSLPPSIYEGSTTQIIEEINRQVIEQCTSLGLSPDEITSLLENARPLVEARRRTEKELLESLVSSTSPDSVARSLVDDMEIGVDMTNTAARRRSIRKANRFGVLDEIKKTSVSPETPKPQPTGKRSPSFSLTNLAKSTGKPTGLQYLLGDLFDNFIGSDSALSRLTEKSARRVMERLVQNPAYAKFIQESTQQMRLQEDKKPLSSASKWITNAATDVFDSVFRGPMDEVMTDYLSHHMKAGLVPNIGEFREVLPKLISPPTLSLGTTAASTAGTASAGAVGAGAVGAGTATAAGTVVGGGATLGGAAAGATAGSVVPVAGTLVGAAVGTFMGKMIGGLRNFFSTTVQQEEKKQSNIMGLPNWGLVVVGIVVIVFIGPFSLLTGGSQSVDLTRRLALVDPSVQGGGFGAGGAIVNCDINPNDPACTFTPCDPTKQECAWPTSGYITQGPYAACGNTSHKRANAIDIGTNGGSPPVYATAKGTITLSYAGCMDNTGAWGNRCGPPGYEGYGNIVILQRDAGGELFFGHLSQQSVLLLQAKLRQQGNNRVEATTQIGRVDHNGNSSGPHLHFEYRGTENINNILPVGPGHTLSSPIPGCSNGTTGCQNCPSVYIGGNQ